MPISRSCFTSRTARSGSARSTAGRAKSSHARRRARMAELRLQQSSRLRGRLAAFAGVRLLQCAGVPLLADFGEPASSHSTHRPRQGIGRDFEFAREMRASGARCRADAPRRESCALSAMQGGSEGPVARCKARKRVWAWRTDRRAPRAGSDRSRANDCGVSRAGLGCGCGAGCFVSPAADSAWLCFGPGRDHGAQEGAYAATFHGRKRRYFRRVRAVDDGGCRPHRVVGIFGRTFTLSDGGAQTQAPPWP
jgi:hypothetical protein